MEKDIDYVTINNLQPGMIIAEDLIQDGSVLISKGIIISDLILERLKEKLILGKIAICVDRPKEEPELKDGKNYTVEEVDSILNDFSVNVEQIFDDVFSAGISEIDEIRNFSKKIRKKLDSAGTVIKNIVLYGSGADAIYRHSVNVAALSSILAKWLNFNEQDTNLLMYAAVLHDFGKTKVDKNVFNKMGQLNDDEYKEIKNHPVTAYNYLKTVPYLDQKVGMAVLMHHERGDGSGYPLGIKDDKIPEFAKIIAIADVFDAVNSNRVYKKRKGPFKALDIIKEESLGKLDYQYCKVFLDHVVNYYIGETVLLNTGKQCKIVQVNPNEISKPLLFDGNEFIDLKNHPELSVEELVL